MTSLKMWLCDFRDLISPRYCAVCRARLNTTEKKLCGACLVGLPYLIEDDFSEGPLARLFWGKIPIAKAWCYIKYGQDSESQNLIHKLKYVHRPDLGVWLGRLMARELRSKGFFDGVDSIVAVPLHWRRQWKRGYNQSLQLALGVSAETGIPIIRRKVRRIRNNESQTHMTTPQRIENTQNLFRAHGNLGCKHVLLIDDVLTTGATLTACAQAIMATSPGIRFSVLTLARA